MTEYSNNKRISLHKLFNEQINIFLKVLIAILKKLQNNKREYNSNQKYGKGKKLKAYK